MLLDLYANGTINALTYFIQMAVIEGRYNKTAEQLLGKYLNIPESNKEAINV